MSLQTVDTGWRGQITAVDPGTEKTAILSLGAGQIGEAEILPNCHVLDMARSGQFFPEVAIEMIACYGMPVGREVFETCLFIGQLKEILEQAKHRVRLVYRNEVKLHLCGTPRAKDPNIRQALIDKYGKPGTAKNPGPTHGITSHLWSALAIADYALSHPQP